MTIYTCPSIVVLFSQCRNLFFLFSLGFSQLSNGRIPSCGGPLLWKSVVVSVLHTVCVCVCNCKACWTRFKERKRWCMSGLEHWRGQPLQSSQQIVGRWIRNRSFFLPVYLRSAPISDFIIFFFHLFLLLKNKNKKKRSIEWLDEEVGWSLTVYWGSPMALNSKRRKKKSSFFLFLKTLSIFLTHAHRTRVCSVRVWKKFNGPIWRTRPTPTVYVISAGYIILVCVLPDFCQMEIRSPTSRYIAQTFLCCHLQSK